MLKNKEKVIGIVIIALSALVTLISYLLLPEVMAVQIGLNGQVSNTLPKLPGVLIPFAISVLGSVQYMTGQPDRRVKNLILAVVGLLIAGFAFFINYGR